MWTPDWELVQYWDKVVASKELTEKYARELKEDLARFPLELMPTQLKTLVDVGAGAFGGILPYFPHAERKIMVDPLALTFKERYGYTAEFECLEGYCRHLPLEDESVDVLFCIETLDHCNSVEEFGKSVAELKRVLKTGGLLFFMLPLRAVAREGHFISLQNMPRRDVLDLFNDMRFLKKDEIYEHLYLTVKK